MRILIGLFLAITIALTYPPFELKAMGKNQTDTLSVDVNITEINVLEGEVIYLECRLNCSEYIPRNRLEIEPPPGVHRSQSPAEQKCPMITYMNYTARRQDSSNFSCNLFNDSGTQQKVRITIKVAAENDTSISEEPKSAAVYSNPVLTYVISGVAIFAVISMFLMCSQHYYLKRELHQRELQSREEQYRLQEFRHDLGTLAEFEIAERNVLREDPIGDGFYGQVYSGYLKVSEKFTICGCAFWFFTSKKTVAIKVPRTSGTFWEVEKENPRETLLNELKVLCQIGNHPNIINLIGSVTLDDIQVVVEKCDNGDLQKYLKKKATYNEFVPQYQDIWTRLEEEKHDVLKQRVKLEYGYRQGYNKDRWNRVIKSGLSTAHLLSFGLQIAEGMEYLVSVNCIHRDLAARNVLLTSEGVVKIGDFGLSRRLREQEEYYRSRGEVGARKWMALEAIETNIANVHTDIWSFGIVLVELFLLGADPYSQTNYRTGDTKETNSEAFLAFIRSGKRCEKPNYCPPQIYEHMLKCWDVDPHQRPNFTQSATFLETHLRAASSELLENIRSKISKEKINLRKYSDYRISRKPTTNLETLSRNVSRVEHDGYKQDM